jgi:hypothetical protein
MLVVVWDYGKYGTYDYGTIGKYGTYGTYDYGTMERGGLSLGQWDNETASPPVLWNCPPHYAPVPRTTHLSPAPFFDTLWVGLLFCCLLIFFYCVLEFFDFLVASFQVQRQIRGIELIVSFRMYLIDAV